MTNMVLLKNTFNEVLWDNVIEKTLQAEFRSCFVSDVDNDQNIVDSNVLIF